ncbi:MAG: MarR family transcriptional regulator [Alcanivoracaceae bacterium]|nr:MarR family transcriptional regulator [Alcanivoracaceae bacterium]
MIKISPQHTVFYTIEKAIKEYRKHAQKSISQLVNDITLDQIMVLTILDSDNDISQKDIAQLLFKDHASITRMIELLVRKEYLSRKTHKEDGRKFQLIITKKGSSTLETLKPIIFQNRIDALNGVSDAKINQLYNTLNTIINNCTN